MRTLLVFLALAIFSCKNETNKPVTAVQPVTSPKAAVKAEEPAEPFVKIDRDTVFGIKGAQMARMKATSPAFSEFTYQNYKIRTEATKENNGEVVRVFDEKGTEIWKLDNTPNAFFMGLSHDNVFVDQGTGPDTRTLMIYDLKKKKLGYNGQYCVETDMFISDSGSLWFFGTVPADKVTKQPNCPDKAEWEKNGLRAGYGQLKMYDLKSGAVITKNEFKCVPLQ